MQFIRGADVDQNQEAGGRRNCILGQSRERNTHVAHWGRCLSFDHKVGIFELTRSLVTG